MKSSSEDDLWIKEELSKANFSDIRLNKRFHTLAQELAAHPRGIKTSRVKERPDVDLYVVKLHELNPPDGEKALVWYLLTSLRVSTRKDALQIMENYKHRWQIEQYFKCLKTWCNIESYRLDSKSKLANYISLQAIIAWRILWMTHIKRNNQP